MRAFPGSRTFHIRRDAEPGARLPNGACVLHPGRFVEVHRQQPARFVLEQGVDAQHVITPQVAIHSAIIQRPQSSVRARAALHLRQLAEPFDELVRANRAVAGLARLLGDESLGVDVFPAAEEISEQADLFPRAEEGGGGGGFGGLGRCRARFHELRPALELGELALDPVGRRLLAVGGLGHLLGGRLGPTIVPPLVPPAKIGTDLGRRAGSPMPASSDRSSSTSTPPSLNAYSYSITCRGTSAMRNRTAMAIPVRSLPDVQ